MARKALPERFSLEPFHRDERPAIVIGDFVNGADVRMIERRRGTCLATEAVDGELRGQEFQRDFASEREVLREIHQAHAAAAEQRLDAIVADGLAGVHGLSSATSDDSLLAPRL